MKVKLVFEKSFSTNRGLSENCFSKTIDIELPENIYQANLIGARCYEPENQSSNPGGDVNAKIWDHEDESRLVGKLLTYIDATYTDKEQRQAHKDIVKDTLYGYFQEISTRAHQLVDNVKEV